MIATRILGTGSVLPGRAVTTAEVTALATPDRSAAEIEAKTGIHTRRWAGPDARVAPIAAEALRRALAAAGLEPSALRRIILATSTGGDTLVPATANAVACELGLHGVCDAFDVNNACSGFLTAFDLGARSTATGLGPVGVVAVELMSHVIRADDPRPFLVFGDAAGAVILGEGRPGEGVLGVSLGNDGSHGSTAYLKQPRYAGAIETVRFGISNKTMSDGAVGKIVESTWRALEQAGERIEDVEGAAASAERDDAGGDHRGARRRSRARGAGGAGDRERGVGVDPGEPRSADANARGGGGGSRADDGRRERSVVGAILYRVGGEATRARTPVIRTRLACSAPATSAPVRRASFVWTTIRSMFRVQRARPKGRRVSGTSTAAATGITFPSRA